MFLQITQFLLGPQSMGPFLLSVQTHRNGWYHKIALNRRVVFPLFIFDKNHKNQNQWYIRAITTLVISTQWLFLENLILWLNWLRFNNTRCSASFDTSACLSLRLRVDHILLADLQVCPVKFTVSGEGALDQSGGGVAGAFAVADQFIVGPGLFELRIEWILGRSVFRVNTAR